MEAKRATPDHEEVETLAEMVGRVMRLYSAELSLNLPKPTFEPAIHDSRRDMHTSITSRNPDDKTPSFKMESEAN